jgi:ATP-dependent phosphoenolpyruvate carboxykinase
MRRASDFGAVLENVVFDSVTRVVDFDDGSKTENQRVSVVQHVHGLRGVHPFAPDRHNVR